VDFLNIGSNKLDAGDIYITKRPFKEVIVNPIEMGLQYHILGI